MTSSSERPPVLIIGGRGFVGAAAARHLLARGERVHVFGPESPVPLPHGATETVGTIEDQHAVRDVLDQVRPGAVASFAAFSSGALGLGRSGELDPERMLAVNVLGFRRLLEACVERRIARLIWTSSTVVLGQATTLDTRLDETAPRLPLGNYALSKVLAEDVAAYMRRRHGIETVGLRIPLMIGPGLWYDGAASALKSMIREARAGHIAEFAVPSNPFDAMHVEDIGELVEILFASPKPLAPIYNLAGFTTSYREIAAMLGDLVPGYAPRLIEAAPPIVFPLVNQALLENETGWRHRRDLRAALTDMMAEMRESE